MSRLAPLRSIVPPEPAHLRVVDGRSPARDVCTVCGATAYKTILTAEAVAQQLAWLESFHRRRLKPVRECRRAALEDRAVFTQDEPRAIVGCRACGLVYRHPRRPAAAVEREYAAYRYGTERLEALVAAQAESYGDKLAALEGWIGRRRRPRVLEIGSFVGGFLSAAGAAGWDARGIDPGAEVVDFCGSRGLAVSRGTIDEVELALAPASVDAVVVWNTFDQIPVPGPTLAAAARIVRPGGVLALRVPNGRYFADAIVRLRHDHELRRRWRLATLAWNNLIGFPYLHGYSVGTLDRLVAPYGFERLAVMPDTLVTLADADTRRWAEIEERVVKTVCRFGWQRQLPGPARVAAAPWLDVYYRWLGVSVR